MEKREVMMTLKNNAKHNQSCKNTDKLTNPKFEKQMENMDALLQQRL